MDLLVRGRSPTEISLKMTEICLKTVISVLSDLVQLDSQQNDMLLNFT